MSANQSRRRTDLGQSPESSTKPKIDNTLPYQRKKLGNDSLRLIEIQPASCEGDPLVCTLTEVAFGSRPRFEALSYMWGTEKANDAITLNGFSFEVGRNLLDALIFLRKQAVSKEACQLFWIDAICINQSNIEERNRQLRIMGEIYLRASTVVVWLGSSYAEFQTKMLGEGKLKGDEKLEEDSTKGGNNTQKEMVKYLRTDPYWDRLWILQEIGQADILRVCFGIESYAWDRFMQLITMHNSDGATGPLRLARLLRQEKYNASHTLKRLLEEHKEAKCSEPRDKVYGLVGLASDAAEFPMDYNKSLYEVWKDTMVFMNKKKLFKDESQILPIGALVKSLLMANHSDPLSQISKEHKDEVDPTQLIDKPNSPLVFHLRAALLGCIVCVGPSASDIVSSPYEATGFRAAIQRLFPADELGSAHQEYDKLLRALLKSDESEVEMTCFNKPSPVVYQDNRNNTDRDFPQDMRKYIKEIQRITGATRFQSPQKPQVTDRLAPVQPRLYLAKQGHGHTLRKMGLVSGVVQPSDVIFWVRSSRRALLARVLEETSYRPKMRVFGTALVTEDICGSTPDIGYEQRWRSLGLGWKTEIQIDAGTLFMLLE